VRPIVGAWEDDWEQLGIGACDVALASRSLSVHDLRAALVKLDRVARREVFVTAPVGAGPIDVRVLEAVGRPFVPGPDYVYPQAVLRELGIRARLTFLSVTHARRYASVADAIERLSWMIPDASASEVGRLRSWLERELVAAAGGLELPPRAQEWAVLSWCKAAAR
jgi:hypothetical protein